MSKTKDGRIKRGTRVYFRGEGVVRRSNGTRPSDVVQIDVPALDGEEWGSTVVVRNADIVEEEGA